jgi:hypothetical protein
LQFGALEFGPWNVIKRQVEVEAGRDGCVVGFENKVSPFF